MALQIRRGLETNLPANPAEGELLYATDSGNLYIGVSGSPNVINLASGGGGGSSNVSSISDLTDVGGIGGITNGQALLWNASANEFQAGTIPAGYSDSDVQTFLSGGTLAAHIIPAGDELYDLGSSTSKFRDLYLSGSTIQLGSSTIQETGSGIQLGNAIVPDASAGNVVVTSELVTANSEMQAYVDTGNAEMKVYVDALETRVVGGANVSLDSLAEVANALANSNTELSSVAFTGNYTDLTNKPSALSLIGSSLSYDGISIDLSAVVGQAGATGPQGPAGADGVDGSDGSDGAQGPQGIQGPAGPTGNAGAQGIQGATGPAGADGNDGADGSDGSDGAQGPQGIQGPAGADSTVAGPQGPQGDAGATGPQGTAGVGIISTSLTGGNLILNYSNTSTQDVGNIQGPQGIQGTTGNDGLTIDSASVNGAGTITLTMNDASTIDVSGNVQGAVGATGSQGIQGPAGNDGSNGADGAQGPQGIQGAGLNDVSVTSASASGSGSLSYNSGTGVFTFTPPDLSSYLTSETDNQALSLVGNILSISNGNTVDLSSVGGASALNDLSDVSTAGVSSGQVLKYNGSSWVPSSDNNSGIGSVAADASPQLGGHLDIAGYDITSNSGSDIEFDPDTSGVVVFKGNATKGSGQFKLNCENNSHGITIKGPAHSAGANYVLTLPTTDGNADQVLKTDGSGNLSWVNQSGGGGGGSQNLFANISVSGQNTIEADSTTDTLTFAAGSGINITTNSTTDTVTIAATGGGGGGGGASVERFKLNYSTSGSLDSTSDSTSGIASLSIDSATSGEVSITFSGYNYPPGAVMLYGYDYANNKYYMSHIETTMATREIAGGGSSGSPTLFDGSATPTIKLRLREAETGASRSFGTATHAWVQMVMND
jgi:hypothetical protein